MFSNILLPTKKLSFSTLEYRYYSLARLHWLVVLLVSFQQNIYNTNLILFFSSRSISDGGGVAFYDSCRHLPYRLLLGLLRWLLLLYSRLWCAIGASYIAWVWFLVDFVKQFDRRSYVLDKVEETVEFGIFEETVELGVFTDQKSMTKSKVVGKS